MKSDQWKIAIATITAESIKNTYALQQVQPRDLPRFPLSRESALTVVRL
jgi:hypothetical protein